MIKNLIFDFGGVIIDIDIKRVGQSFHELGIKDLEKVHRLAVSKGLYLDLEKGLITPAEFHEGLREVSGLKLTDDQIDYAWNSMILDLPRSRFELVKQLKENYNVYLLSNTNEIHYQYFNQYVINNLGVDCLDDFFTGCFYSHRMKMHKPDQEIFIEMIERAKIKPSESLYIDDLAENIAVASELGFHGIVHNPDEEIDQYFENGRIKSDYIFSSFSSR
jgi:FMN phosphatase YigB (HAD superfamily)